MKTSYNVIAVTKTNTEVKMEPFKLNEQIVLLRKAKGITQEKLAQGLQEKSRRQSACLLQIYRGR